MSDYVACGCLGGNVESAAEVVDCFEEPPACSSEDRDDVDGSHTPRKDVVQTEVTGEIVGGDGSTLPFDAVEETSGEGSRELTPGTITSPRIPDFTASTVFGPDSQTAEPFNPMTSPSFRRVSTVSGIPSEIVRKKRSSLKMVSRVSTKSNVSSMATGSVASVTFAGSTEDDEPGSPTSPKDMAMMGTSSTSSDAFKRHPSLRSNVTNLSHASRRVSFGRAFNNTAIVLTTPKEGQAVKPGGTIAGSVYLNVIDSVEADCLQVSIIGAEDAKLTYKVNIGQGRKKKKEKKRGHNFHNFMLSRSDITTFPDGFCPAGQFAFPFRCTLPDGSKPLTNQDLVLENELAESSGAPARMASTFYQRDGKDCCEVRYYVESRLFKEGWFEFETLAQKAFVMAVPLPATLPPSAPGKSATETPVWMCRCFQSGQIKLNASIDGDCFLNGTAVEIKYEAKNESKLIITEVVVELVERIWWGAVNIKKSAKKWKRSFETTSEELFPADELNKGNKKMSSNKGPISIIVPSTFREDYSGELLGVSHFVRVSLKCDDEKRPMPEVTIPITVFDSNVATRRKSASWATIATCQSVASKDCAHATLSSDDEDEDDDDEDFGDEEVRSDGMDKMPPRWRPQVAAEKDVTARSM